MQRRAAADGAEFPEDLIRMDERYDEGVITFAQLWKVFKKSLLKAIIYVVVCAVIAFAVMYAIRVITRTSSYTAYITFLQDDVSSAPDILRENKAKSLSAALADTKYADDDDVYKDIYNEMTITAVIPSANSDDTSYIPVEYKISFRSISGLTKEEQISVLNDTVTNLMYNYAFAVGATEVMSEGVWFTVPDTYDVQYLELLSELDDSLDSVIKSVENSIAAEEDFGSYRSMVAYSGTGDIMTPEEILNRLQYERQSLATLEEYVYSRGIRNEQSLLDVSEYIEMNTASLKIQEDAYNRQIEYYNNAIDNLNGYDTTDAGSVLQSLVDRMTEIDMQLTEVELELDYYNRYSNAVEGLSSELNREGSEYVEEQIAAVADDVNALLSYYNDIASEYNEYVVPRTYARVSGYAKAVSSSAVGWTLIIIIVLLVAVIAYLVAYGTTWSKMSAAGTLYGDDGKNRKEKDDGMKTVAE